jgi:amidase
LGDYKVAVWADDIMAPVDQTIKARVLQVAKLVEEAGGQVDYDVRPNFDVAASHDAFFNLLQSAMSARQSDEVFEDNLARRQGLAAGDKGALAQVTKASTLYYRQWHQFNEKRTHLRWAWHEFFKQWDVLLTPMCVTSAFAHDHNPQTSQRTITVNNEPRPYFEQVFWAGLTGVSYLPSTIVPTGLDAQQLPVGVQIVGREMGDRVTIEFARQVAALQGGFVAPAAYAD